MRRIIGLLIPWVALTGLALGQERDSSRKPVLIRADRTEEQSEEIPLVPDPEKAREHVEVGDFYYRRDNYEAAAKRYREAILYGPTWPEGYEKLVQALEKQQAFLEAIEVCEEFLLKNGSSDKIERFEKWAEKLKEESKKAGESEG
jgi:tetratricopeptide (TPR) repeat protein